MNSVYGKNAGLIATAQKSCSDETVAEIKRTIKGQIAIAAAKYDKPKKEEVEFIALRFCRLATEIERVFNQAAAPINQLQAQSIETNRVLSATGNIKTLDAINAGATRFDTQARVDAAIRAGTVPATAVRGGIANLPQGTLPYAGHGAQPNLPQGYQFPSYEDALKGIGGIRYAPGPSSSLSGRAGFIPRSVGGGVDPDGMYMMYRLAEEWGSTITIVSAYRNPKANDAAGGKTGSQHLAGKAFDCSISGRSNQIRFLNLAYRIGFRGFGTYDTFTHVDAGNARSWGNFKYYSLTGPSGSKGT